MIRRLRWTSTRLLAVALAAGGAVAQTPLAPQELALLRTTALHDNQPEPAAPPTPIECRDADLIQAPIAAPLVASENRRAAQVFYSSLRPGNINYLWFYGTAYWALDDGVLDASAITSGGAHITEYEFAFAVHYLYPGDSIRPYVVVNFYEAPPDPVAQATNPVVDPPQPVSSIGWLFDPVTSNIPSYTPMRSGMLDLVALGLDFDLNESFYIEIIPLEWSSAPTGEPQAHPSVLAMFAGPGNLTVGQNQNHMWSDWWYRSATCAHIAADLDGYYDHPAEMDLCVSNYLNQSAFTLRGFDCLGPNRLDLRISDPRELCVRPGQTVTVTLAQACLVTPIRGYQAFLEYTPGALEFQSGEYILPLPYGLPILTPITALDGQVSLAAGIDDFAGQLPTLETADLAQLTFVAGATEGLTQVRFHAQEPPTRFSDAFGQPVLPLLTDAPVICVDGTPPALTCPPDLVLSCLFELPPIATNYDDFVAQGGLAHDSGCGGAAAPAVTVISETGNSGTGCGSDPLVITRVYRATDCAGNYAECTQIITIVDDAPPQLLDVPPDRSAPTIAGDCSLAVLVPPLVAPTAEDNCTPETNVAWVRSDGKLDLAEPFAIADSPVTITWSSTDACGNTALATTVITVVPLNDLVVTVQLQPAFAAGPVSRCITFEVWQCPATAPLHTFQATLTFVDGVASATLPVLPCDAYSCITARDALHTLRRTHPVTVAGTQYATAFVGDPATGGDWLIGGNFNGDAWIDIVDFGVFSNEFANHPLPGANTDCNTPAPHADASGNGRVNTGDFPYVQVNYLHGDEPNCCGQADLNGGAPAQRIAVAELYALGLGELADGDLNADGWLDAQDIVAFMRGQRPRRPLAPAAPAAVRPSAPESRRAE